MIAALNNLNTQRLDEMITNNFTPIYKNLKDKSKIIKQLMSIGKGKDILLAADDDREGEAIAWHLCKVFKLSIKNSKRLIFNSIA